MLYYNVNWAAFLKLYDYAVLFRVNITSYLIWSQLCDLYLPDNCSSIHYEVYRYSYLTYPYEHMVISPYVQGTSLTVIPYKEFWTFLIFIKLGFFFSRPKYFR